MAVGVDQAWCEQSSGQLKHLQGCVLKRFSARCDQCDAPVADADIGREARQPLPVDDRAAFDDAIEPRHDALQTVTFVTTERTFS